ncbi:unknown [Bacteroides intestinalis CAG:564]|nr:unknown [Bacteroides intestinalis CAG:564]
MLGTNHHTPVFFGVADGVAQKIRQYPSYLFTIHKQFRHLLVGIFHFYLNTKFISLHLIGLNGILNKLDRLRYLRHHLELAGFYLCHIQEFTGDTQQAVGILFNAFR